MAALSRREFLAAGAALEDGGKLIASFKGEHELYHLKDDPGEARNLAKAQPAKLKELLATLEAWKQSTMV